MASPRAERLVAVIAVLEEQPTFLVLGQEGRRLPTVFEALRHGGDVALPLLGLDGHERVVLGAGEAHEILERHLQRPEPPVLILREAGRERRVVAAPAGEEIADPGGQVIQLCCGEGGGEAESPVGVSHRAVMRSARSESESMRS